MSTRWKNNLLGTSGMREASGYEEKAMRLRGVHLENGMFYDLQELTDRSPKWERLVHATAINDSNQIAGVGLVGAGSDCIC